LSRDCEDSSLFSSFLDSARRDDEYVDRSFNNISVVLVARLLDTSGTEGPRKHGRGDAEGIVRARDLSLESNESLQFVPLQFKLPRCCLAGKSGRGGGRGGREIRKSSPTEPPSVEPPSSLTHMTHSVRFLLTRMSISSSRSVIRVISRYLALSPEKVVSRVPCTSNPNRTNRNRLNSPVDSRWPSTTFRCVKLSFVFGSAIASHLCIFM